MVFAQNMNDLANLSPVDYVNPLMGKASNFSLSNCNTNSVIAILLEKDDLPLTISCSFILLAKQLRYGANEFVVTSANTTLKLMKLPIISKSDIVEKPSK
jgi:hypothetical protein